MVYASILSSSAPLNIPNPIDRLEMFFEENQFLYQRQENEKIVVDALSESDSCAYKISFSWDQYTQAIYFICLIPFEYQKEQVEEIHCLASKINNSLGMGHFEVETTQRFLTYRHTITTRGLSEVPLSMLLDIMDVGLSECERVLPVLDLTINHNYESSKALAESRNTKLHIGYA